MFKETPKASIQRSVHASDMPTITGASKGSDWTFLGSKTDLVTSDVKDPLGYKITKTGILPQFSPIVHPDTTGDTRSGDAGSVQKGYDLSEFMTDDQKAFDFMPDIPKEDTADARAYGGLVKGASNTMAGIWNIGTMFQDYALGRDSAELDYKGFYATPVTALETGVVEGAVGTIYSKGQFGLDTGAFSREVGEGIGQAGQIIQDRPVESITSTLVEGVPYAIGSGVKGTIKFFGNLGKTLTGKTASATGSTGKTTGSTSSGFGFDFGSIGKTTPTKFSKADQNKIKMYAHPDRPTGSDTMFKSVIKKFESGKPNGELTSILAKQNKILSGKATTPSTPNIPIRQSMPNSNVLNLTAKNIIAKQGGDVLGSQALTKVSKIDNLVPSTTKKPKGTDVSFGKMDLDFVKPKGKLKLPDSSLPVKKTPSSVSVKKTVDTSVPMKTNFGVPKYDPSGPRKTDPVKNPPKIFGGIMPFGSGMGGGGSGSGVGKINRYGKKSFTAWDVSTDSISMKGDTYVTSSHAGVLDTKFSNTAKKKKKGSAFGIDTTFNM